MDPVDQLGRIRSQVETLQDEILSLKLQRDSYKELWERYVICFVIFWGVSNASSSENVSDAVKNHVLQETARLAEELHDAQADNARLRNEVVALKSERDELENMSEPYVSCRPTRIILTIVLAG